MQYPIKTADELGMTSEDLAREAAEEAAFLAYVDVQEAELMADPKYVAHLEAQEREYAARGRLAGSPWKIRCQSDGGQMKLVTADIGTTRGPDPWTLYRLECGHSAVAMLDDDIEWWTEDQQ